MFLSAYVFANRRTALDQLLVWQYEPTSEVIQLAKDSGLAGYGEFIYLASQPSIDPAESFNENCSTAEYTSSILGCYVSSRIYVYDIEDESVSGVKEVTAAHETLHAAYARLKPKEISNINKLLDVEYQKIKNDEGFSERMAFYDKHEPGQRYDELHSIIGTEIADVSLELEAYYSKYFSDRSKVVALNESYLNVFKEISDRADNLSNQLTDLSTSLNERTQKYESDLAALNADIATFNKKANEGVITLAQFNSERAILTVRVNSINATRDSISADSDRYNKMLDEYNSIVIKSKKMYDSIDSKKLQPVESI